MRLRRLLWIVAALAAAALVHVATIHLVPIVLMRVAMSRMAAEAGVNRAGFAPRADEESRAVVRPSPDLLYSSCVFDVSEAPLRVRAEIPAGTYWSISFFAANTDNFFKLNDREMPGGSVELVLARRGQRFELPPGARRIEAASDRGIVLTRTLVDDESRLAELDRARRSFTCEPMR
jgi:uncharacterized membrane protein